jgi:Ras GTPase-activating-like protein IQGAP2/3
VHKSTSGYGEWLLTTSPLGILLGVRDFSPRQYNQITIVLASNEIGIFSLEISVPPGLGAGLSGRDEVRMEDLLQAQFDNQLNLLLFDGAVTFSIDELIKQINKSEWAKH